MYQGQKEVNGLLTDVWAAEESFLSPRTRQFVNWTTTYYWTARSWRTADGSATVPVRAVVEGAHVVRSFLFAALGPINWCEHIYIFDDPELPMRNEFQCVVNCNARTHELQCVLSCNACTHELQRFAENIQIQHRLFQFPGN